MASNMAIQTILFFFFSIAASQVDYHGRFSFASDGSSASFDWSGTWIQYQFSGSSVSVSLDDSGNQYLATVDSSSQIITSNGSSSYNLASGLGSGTHKVTLYKRTEASCNYKPAVFKGFSVDNGPLVVKANAAQTGRRLEFWGDSITCGYGILGTSYDCHFSIQTEDESLTYASLTSNNFGAELHVEAWSGKGVVRNYGDPNPTSTNPMPIYIPLTSGNDPNTLWDWSKWAPNAVVINLGTNDFSTQPNPDQTTFENGYFNLTSLIRSVYPSNTYIFAVCGPLIGDPCCSYVQNVVQTLNNKGDAAVKYVDMENILTFPDDYGCDYHPNTKGHQKMANILIPIVKSALGW